jgi:competence protein ComEC
MNGLLPEAEAFLEQETGAAAASGAFPRFFVPWPWPAAAGCALGIICARLGLAPAGSLWLLAAGLPALAWFLRGASRRARREPALLSVLLVFLCAAAAGQLRFSHWQDQPDPLAGLYGQELVFSGFSDGSLLRVTSPLRVTVELSPRNSVAPGLVQVRGVLQQASGKRNPGGFDHAALLRLRNIAGQLLVREVTARPGATTLRERFRQAARTGLQGQRAAIVEALTLGVRDNLGDLRETFAAAGVAHLLALSGLHVGVVLLAAGRLLAGLGSRRYPLLLLLLVLYVQLIGVTPSILRAAIMAGSVLLLLWSGFGRIRPWTAFSLAAFITLLLHPAWLFDLSFQLSYGAVAGIMLLATPLARRLQAGRRLPWWHPRVFVAAAVVTSVAAQLPTLSLVASEFGGVPLLSPLVNVLAIPLTTLLVPLGNAAALAGLFLPAAAGALNLVTGLLAGTLIWLAQAAAQLPVVPWGEVSNAGHWYWLVAALAVVLAVRQVLRPVRALAVILCALLAAGFTPPGHPEAEFIAFDVGQGDSVLLRFPGRINILVDGGGATFSDFRPGERIVVPALRALGVNHLDLVVATHADTDHMQGLIDVLALLPVQQLVIGQQESGRPLFDELLEVARRRGVGVRQVRRGESLLIGGVELVVLNPRRHGSGASNDESVVLEVHWRGLNQVLLPGDLPASAERGLAPAPARILLVPHHGSRHSSSAGLLRQVAGEHAVISVGRNNYGHPHPLVLERLEAAGYQVHVTRAAGAVRLPLVTPSAGLQAPS